ncbi:hypothetical protein CEP53_007369 [Fusarium sp. AF-6]|nr:hypothetical protein CEP53_007369 [Fusarium sp. AF-6]
MTAAAKPPTSTFALIIGAGPVGLYTAIALAGHGYRSIIVERQAVRRLEQPKAHAINSRALEILKQAGIPLTDLRSMGAEPSDADLLRFESSLSGIEFGSMPYERQDEAVKEFTPEPLTNIPQPKLEAYLQRHAEKTGLVTIHYSWQWQSCVQESAGRIQSEVVNLTVGSFVRIDSQYLLACDGAHSRARTAFGISTSIPRSAYPTSVRYISATMTADWTRFRSGMLHVIIQGQELRVFIAYERSSTWVFMFGVPYDDSFEKYTEEYCRAAIDKAVGEKTDYTIDNICSWEAALRISDTYRSKKFPNAFVLGDAAHSFPNAGGLGVNTGFADVHNLVWKIHAAEKGWTTQADALLDTYTAERKPVAEASCRISDYNQFRVTEICSKVSSTMANNPSANWQDPEKRKLLQDTINAQWSFSDHLNLHIGYVYGMEDLGLAPQGNEKLPANSLFYKPRCIPGVRLPHGWVTRQGETVTVSTLDLVDWSAFTVFAAQAHGDLPTSTKGPNGVPVVYQQLDRDFSDKDGKWSSIMGFMADQGLVVVRPDQHILGIAATVDQVGQLLLEHLGL